MLYSRAQVITESTISFAIIRFSVPVLSQQVDFSTLPALFKR